MLDFHTMVMSQMGIGMRTKKQDAIDRIIEVVCKHFDVRYEKIRGSKRLRDVIMARHTLSFCLRHGVNQQGRFSMTYREVGEVVGRRDHTSIMYSIKEIEKRYVTDKHYRLTLAEIASNIYSNSLDKEIQRLNKEIII